MGIIDQAWEKRLTENNNGGMPVQELAKGVLEMGKLAYVMGWQDCISRQYVSELLADLDHIMSTPQKHEVRMEEIRRIIREWRQLKVL